MASPASAPSIESLASQDQIAVLVARIEKLEAIKEGFHYILIEQQEEYCEIARKRVAAVPARLDRWAEAGI